MTQLSSSLSLIAGALGGDPSDMDEAFLATLGESKGFRRLDGSDFADVRYLPAGTSVLVEPTVEPRCFEAYVVLDWATVFTATVYKDQFVAFPSVAAA